MEPVYKASGNYYPAPNSQQQPGYWSEYTGAVTQGPGGQAVTQLSLSPQVVVTMLPPRPHPAVITDHSKSDQREPEANNNIVDSQDSSVSSSVIAGQTPRPSYLIKSRPQTGRRLWRLFLRWAQVVNTGLSYPGMELSISQAESLLCPFYKVCECR